MPGLAQMQLVVTQCRAGGALEIYCLPDMRLILSASGLPGKAPLLAMPSPGSGGGQEATEDDGFPDVSVRELLVETFSAHTHASGSTGSGSDGASSAPHLVATLSDDSVVVYRAFNPPQVPCLWLCCTFRPASLKLQWLSAADLSLSALLGTHVRLQCSLIGNPIYDSIAASKESHVRLQCSRIAVTQVSHVYVDELVMLHL